MTIQFGVLCRDSVDAGGYIRFWYQTEVVLNHGVWIAMPKQRGWTLKQWRRIGVDLEPPKHGEYFKTRLNIDVIPKPKDD